MVTATLPKLPTFPLSVAGNSGLDLLAAAASLVATGSISHPLKPSLPQGHSTLQLCYQPSCLDLDFIEISDITTDDPPASEPDHQHLSVGGVLLTDGHGHRH